MCPCSVHGCQGEKCGCVCHRYLPLYEPDAEDAIDRLLEMEARDAESES